MTDAVVSSEVAGLRGEVRALDLSRLEFRFAKTMPETPHWYVVRTATNEADYIALFHAIREKGVDERFGGRRYRYWYPGDGFKYWAMTTDVRRSHVINRAKAADDDGPDLSGYDPTWSISTPAERAEALKAEVAQMEAWKRRDQRRDQRREEARQLRLTKAALRAGLPVKAATIGGLALEFGQPESEPAGATLTPLEAWKAKKRARNA